MTIKCFCVKITKRYRPVKVTKILSMAIYFAGSKITLNGEIRKREVFDVRYN
ncbi:MAG: hypothetical protein ACOX1I_01850 [Dethiobacteria bacterium]